MMNQTSFTKRAFLVLACAAAAGLFSCNMDFFATSWGENAKRDPGAMTVNADNVTKLLKNARGNPEMSMTILDKIAKDINNASASDKQKLREAALVAAAQATDVAGLVVSSIDKISTAMNGTGDVKPENLLNSIMSSVDMGKASHAGADLVTILPDVNDNGEFKEDFKATDAELMQAAFVIILGEVGDSGTVENYFADWGNRKNLNSVNNLDDNEKALIGIMNKLSQQSPDNSLVAGLKDSMGGA